MSMATRPRSCSLGTGRRADRPGFRYITEETVMPLIRRIQQNGTPTPDEATA